MLNKRIKDKAEDIDRLTKELDYDAKKKVELEEEVEVGKICSCLTKPGPYNPTIGRMFF